jgi:hypothetical protein
MSTKHMPLSIRLYLLSRRVWRLVGDICAGAFDGFWLSVLGRDAHDRVVEYHYLDAAEYRSDSYNLDGLFPWEEKVVAGHFADCRRILVGGAGGGREMVALAQLGYEVAGFECNPTLVEYANGLLARKEIPTRVEHVPPDVCPAVDAPYDGIIIGWCAYMHIQGRNRRVAFLRSLRPALKPGAPVLLSFWHINGPARRRLRVTQRVAGPLRRLLGREPITLGDSMAPHRLQYFDEELLREELVLAGFELKIYKPWFGHEYGHAVVVARDEVASSAA